MTDRVTRARRDTKVLNLFIAGATYKQIGEHPDIALGISQVDRIVKRELARAAKRRDLLADQALTMWVERSEALLRANWAKAMGGDYRAGLLCDRILARQARLGGLVDDRPGGGSGGGGPVDPPDDPDGGDSDADGGDEGVTELDDYRRRHGLA